MYLLFLRMNLVIIQIVFFKPLSVQIISPTIALEISGLNMMK